MRAALFVIGILLFAAGLVWVAQGLNVPFAPPSFMTADRTWIFIGTSTAAVGAALVAWSRRRIGPGG